MRSALERAQSLLSWIAARPAGRKLYHAIPGDHIKEDPDSSLVSATLFEPENSYYSVRIVELHLQNAGEYFRNFLPMLLTLSEFNRGGEATTHPYFVSNERLKDALGSSGANIGAVQIQDVYALRL